MKTELLKAKILDLLIKGELTAKWREEHKDIESAEVLLEKIRSEKEKKLNGELIAKGKKPTAKVEFKEVRKNDEPFEIPLNWKWIYLGDICDYGKCNNAAPEELNEDSWILDLEDIEKNTGKILQFKTYKERKSLSTKHIFYKDDVLYSKLRPYLNKVVIAPKDGFCTSEILPLDFNNALENKYAQKLLMSPYFLNTVNLLTSGVRMPRLGTETANKILLPIPPLEEQKEIARIAEILLNMVDDIDGNYSNLEELSKKAKAKVLDLLIKGELTSKWRDEHKETENADVLLEKIKNEREKILNEKLIAKGKKPNSKVEIKEVSKNDELYEIPLKWKWCRFGDICSCELGKTKDSGRNTGKEYDYLCSINVGDGYIKLSKIKKMKFEEDEFERYSVIKNDLLICEGGDVGRCAIWDKNYSILYQNALHRVRFFAGLEPKFFLYLFTYYKKIQYFDSLCKGVTIKHLTGNILKFVQIPLPPLDEQKEIVRIADTLLNQIDSLTNIDSSQTGDEEDE